MRLRPSTPVQREHLVLILILIAIGAWRTPLVKRWRNASDIAARQAIS